MELENGNKQTHLKNRCSKKLGDLTLLCNGALLVEEEDEKVAILGDIHIGYDSELAPPYSLPFSYIDYLKKEFLYLSSLGISRIIINGDIQHDFSPNNKYALTQLLKFLEFIHEFNKVVDVEIIKGNHDTYLHKILSKNTSFPITSNTSQNNLSDVMIPKLKEYTFVGEYIVFHGHTFPQAISKEDLKNKKTITSHEHPIIVLKDEVGGRIRLRSFLFFPSPYSSKSSSLSHSQHIILPAFLPFTSGSDLLSIEDNDLMNVVLSSIPLRDWNIYAIDPYNAQIIYFGSVGELRKAIRVNKNI